METPRAYEKNYYNVLGLRVPSRQDAKGIEGEEVKRAYRGCLLRAHPDKKGAGDGGDGKYGGDGAATAGTKTKKTEPSREKGSTYAYTVDDVKNAYSVLGDAKERARYDAWLFGPGGRRVLSKRKGGGIAEGGAEQDENDNEEFILGLEVLDLDEDFEVLETPAPAHTEVGKDDTTGDQDIDMQWTRACRCGAEHGFRITEAELEAAVERKEGEVLVGCVGCSLWVRVGFGVVED